MAWNLVIFFLVSTVLYVNASECKYCRGNACEEDSIPIIQCNDHPRHLSYQFEDKSLDFDNQKNVCIELTYVDEKYRRFQVKQCWTHSKRLCKKISSTLPSSVILEECVVLDPNQKFNELERVIDNRRKTHKDVIAVQLPKVDEDESFDISDPPEPTTTTAKPTTTAPITETTTPISTTKPTTTTETTTSISTTKPTTTTEPTTSISTTKPTTTTVPTTSTSDFTTTEIIIESTTQDGNASTAILSLFVITVASLVHFLL